MGKIRDYTTEQISKFEAYLDEYYDASERETSTLWNKIKSLFSLFTRQTNIVADSDGQSEKFIQRMRTTREAAEMNIITIWQAVDQVESNHCGLFKAASSNIDAYSSILEKISSKISLNSFSNPSALPEIINDCRNEYMTLIEPRVNTLLDNKAACDLSDGEIEMLAYVYINSDDIPLQNRIANYFYYDNTSEHINLTKDTPDELPHYYDRYEDSWNKFHVMESYYFSSYYGQYLDGQLSDEEISTVLSNHLTIDYIDKNGSLLYSENDIMPIQITSDGIVSLDIPDIQNINLWYSDDILENNSYNNLGRFTPQNGLEYGLDNIPHNTHSMHLGDVRRGAAAELHIESEVAETIAGTDQPNYSSMINKKITGKVEGSLKKAANAELPGSGKALGILFDMSREAEDFWNKPSENYIPPESKDRYGNYIRLFDIVYVDINDGGMLFSSPNTENQINKFLEWAKDNRPDLYDKYLSDDTEDFLQNTNVPFFMNDLLGLNDNEYISLVEYMS